MKKLLKSLVNILRIGIALCLFVGCFYFAYDYLNHYFKTDGVNDGVSFHSLPKESMDVIVLGSSHAQYSFVPSFFYEDTGLFSYVLGSACQPLEVSYQMLNEALKTQSPKALVLEVFTSMPKRSMCEADSCLVLAAYQMTGEERIDTFNYLPEEKAATYYNDFLNNHNDWKNIDLSALKLSDFDPEVVMKGYDISAVSTTFGYEYADALYSYPDNWWRAEKGGHYDEDVELDETDLWALNGIYDLCSEKGIQLILYKTPIDSMEAMDNAYLKEVWKWAEERDVPYVDFFDKQKELGFYMWIHSDSYHAFVTGASIMTDYLADFVSDLNIEFDHKDNEVLQSKYEIGAMTYDSAVITMERDPSKIVNRINGGSGYTVIRYNPIYESVKMNVPRYLDSLGLTGVDRYGECHAILHDGEVIAQGSGSLEVYVEDHSIYVDNGVLILDGVEYYFDNCNLYLTYLDLKAGRVSAVKGINTATAFENGWIDYDND